MKLEGYQPNLTTSPVFTDSSQANATLTGMCQVAVEIEYTVKFAELITPTQS